jgi:hypothetical protein
MSEKSVCFIEGRLIYPLPVVLFHILEVKSLLVEIADIVGQLQLRPEAVLFGEVSQLAEMHPLRLVDFVVAHLEVLELFGIGLQQTGVVHIECPVGVVGKFPDPQQSLELRLDADLLEDLSLHAFLQILAKISASARYSVSALEFSLNNRNLTAF